ncbi:MAG: type II toxin-antitoxin system HicB family antitoxin [Gammaproteobacteria bacterium]|nr:type II toxin-antitoxin system HicB family antitoxin [Gammaproteobacteria bacterium]MBP9729198.1 type II toxin-antitoxin system HicB family antitoxin [Gammaproteobacteria bacterium]
MTEVKYPLTIKPLSKEEGGGYQVEYLDLPGCMADGETVEEALKEGEDAVLAWIRSAQEDGEPIPEPGSMDKYSGQWRIRVPKSLHAQLDAKAKLEGVSLNTLSIALLAEGITRRNTLNHLRRN